MDAITSPDKSNRFAVWANRPWRIYLGTFLVFAVLYGATAQRGPAWQDSGIYQWRIVNFDLSGWLGLALAHPLLITLGKLFSFVGVGPLAWRLNMVSAVFAALAAANVALLVRRLAPDRPAAGWLAGGFFGLAHTVWWLATVCESQAVFVALLTFELHVLVSLVRRPSLSLVLLLATLNGLALTGHNMALLALPAYGLVVLYLCSRRRLSWIAVLLMVAGWIVGAAGILILIAQKAATAGLFAAVHSALFGKSWRGAVLGLSSKPIAMGAGYVLYNFPNLAGPLMIAGLWSLRKRLPRLLAWSLAYLAGIYFLFAIRYRVPDQFMFFLPFYATAAVLAGLGIASLTSRSRRRWLVLLAWISLAVAPVAYAATPSIWRAGNLPLPGRKDLPFRDPAEYWLAPWKNRENSAGLFARAALRQVPTGGIIIADSTSYYPLLWVQRMEGIGRGVRVMPGGDARPDRIHAGTWDVFVVSDLPRYHPAWLDERASFKKDSPDSVVFRVAWK